MATKSNEVKDELEEIEKIQRRKENVFRQVLDEHSSKSGHVLATRSKMGITSSFITAASLGWIAANVRFARDLPFWHNKKDESGRLLIDETTLAELSQREPDWSRQIQMVRYLIERENHKFPTIIVVARKEWTDDKNANEWKKDGCARENSVTEVPLDTKGSFIDLDCENTEFYALDGQHRLMALIGLADLLKNRSLPHKKKNGHVIPNKTLTLKEAQKRSASEMQTLLNEKMGIEIIPAVQKDEPRVKALRRLRTIFVHVNRQAKRLTKGEIILLEDDDGFAIVAKNVMVSNSLLKNKKRVESKMGQLRDSAHHYTTLETLVEITRLFLGHLSFPAWKPKEKNDMPLRPDDDELEKGLAEMDEYFEFLSQLPSHDALIQDQSKSAGDFRDKKNDFSSAKHEDNILFRPIAQMAFAEAMAELIGEKRKKFKHIIQTLVEHEQKGDLQLRDPKSIWFGVLCDLSDRKMRRQKRYQSLCSRLFVHLLGGGTPEESRTGLEQEFREARKLEEDIYVGLDGKHVKRVEDIKLPQPW